MSEGIITRRASDIRPLLLDRFRNAAAAYSLRPLTLSGQDNPVVKVRRSVDDTEQDFSPAQINDGTLEQFVNAGDVAPADYGTGAAAAYSLRYVSDGYTGDVIRVRESTNNTEQDFNPTEIEDGTLLAFCGAGDGLVTTWYDQSGNGNDATQSTAGSQPKIVSGGSLVTENGKPAIDFDGSDDFFSASSWGISGTQDRSFFITAKADITSSSYHYAGIGDGTNGANSDKWLLTTEFALRVYGGNEIYGSPSTSQALVSHIFSGTNVTDNTAYINGTESVATSSNPTTISTDDTVNLIGSGGHSLSAIDTFNGKYQELLIYDSDQSSNRELIETNVNHYYSIYSQTNDGFVTTWYDQSGNGNDATQSTAGSQPKIVDAGVLVTENGKPAIDFDENSSNMVLNTTQSLPMTFFIVNASEQNNNDDILLSNGVSGGNGIHFGFNNGAFLRDYPGQSEGSSHSLSAYEQNLISAKLDGVSDKGYINTNLISNYSGSVAVFSHVSVPNSAQAVDGTIQEIIIYDFDQSNNRQQIESNINNHYGIY